ncbi:hypothetical protein N0V88_006035 [Collariella sp. IMI 366227]|nr:hypothetical protein N0V88_006035 [Collariella sp. IMI 366227]
MSAQVPVQPEGLVLPRPQRPSLLFGPTDPPLVDLTLGELLNLQCLHHGHRESIVIPWTGARWTYNELNHHSRLLAAALLEMGIGVGDRVGIMAGNCEQYAAVFFAATRIGAILVILNNTYTPTEAQYGLDFSECKVFFTTKNIGRLDQQPLLAQLAARAKPSPKVVIIRGDSDGYASYKDMLADGSRVNPDRLHHAEAKVLPHLVCNLQFTSGTTGLPKAAMLTHHNIVNNSRFIGDRMRLTPPTSSAAHPLFHCFGLVLGLMSVITHGAKIVYPAEVFDAPATLRAIIAERCTAVHGVPAMFDSLLALPEAKGLKASDLHLRTGIVAGAPVPRYLMETMVAKLGMQEFTSSYGLTEASPTCFNAFTDDPIATRLTTVGTLMPHARAKIVDRDGVIAGYWNNSEKTSEVMARDEAGVLWLHTGDEAVFDERGYCSITGRFKDIIIRGGENIYPLEIEERLVAHPAVGMAVVVGLKDEHYGEVVGAFLDLDAAHGGKQRLGLEEVREWVRKKLGKHKAPTHVFWLGVDGVPTAVPLTGSGKVRKFEMAQLGNKLLEGAKAKL